MTNSVRNYRRATTHRIHCCYRRRGSPGCAHHRAFCWGALCQNFPARLFIGCFARLVLAGIGFSVLGMPTGRNGRKSGEHGIVESNRQVFPIFSGRRAAPPGYRDAGNYNGFGALRGVGGSGYSWSSSSPAESGDARNLAFYPHGIVPQASASRAFGLQLRCLQE
jgi:hypothetical protein